MLIKCVARDSPLSHAQVREVFQHASFPFVVDYIKSRGDFDQKSCLINMAKNDFFTRELDEALLNQTAQVAIHSAKDLPSPLPQGLHVAAMTKSINSLDTLVLKEGITLDDIPIGGDIGASSYRREQMIQLMRSDLKMRSIRGTIEKRIALLDDPTLYGVVIAKAALIRLNLLHLNSIDLPGVGAEHQGRLAIVCRDGDSEMINLFAPLHYDAHSISRN
ncbi:MAG: hydroxymethylbilane synthase [Rhabdochlamydiaceae bacterium]|nr:hydroxymethylbilane synthase [Candidatus Amphrikana amoebophyrae]